MASAEGGKASHKEERSKHFKKTSADASRSCNKGPSYDEISKSRASSSITEDVAKHVEEENFYHGLLPREDITSILEKVGDFIVRTTQPRPSDPREIVISVRVSVDESDPMAIRHVVVRKRKKQDGRIEWRAIEAENFSTVRELIENYIASRRPINPEVKASILIRPIKRKPWEFLHDDIKLKDLLGEGQFGEVRAGEALVNGKRLSVAIKVAKVVKEESQMAKAKEKIKEMMHEARLMRYFKHINVVRIHGVAVLKEPLMIVMERVYGGSIIDVLTVTRVGQVGEDEKIGNMSLGAARGLEYVHSKNCIHRDIAARNVLYTDTRIAKISDFGMSRKGDIYEMSRARNKKIPLKWTAPESMVALQYTKKTDVFSFSILLWEIFSNGSEPYQGMTSLEVKRMISCGERMKAPEGCPNDMYELMTKCWEQNPSKRITMTEVVRYIEGLLSQECGGTTTATQATREESSDDGCTSTVTTATSKGRSKKKRAHKQKKRKHRHKHRRRRKTQSLKERKGDASDEKEVVKRTKPVTRRRRQSQNKMKSGENKHTKIRG
uniref:Tyrosine-protein kinase n=1 Tax=Parascaris univalens TaxID=6257 RepID=A0A915BXR4_PARUN